MKLPLCFFAISGLLLITFKPCSDERQNSFKLFTEEVVQRCSVKKVFLEISQNSQENTCARVSFLINEVKSLMSTKPLLYFHEKEMLKRGKISKVLKAKA